MYEIDTVATIDAAPVRGGSGPLSGTVTFTDAAGPLTLRWACEWDGEWYDADTVELLPLAGEMVPTDADGPLDGYIVDRRYLWIGNHDAAVRGVQRFLRSRFWAADDAADAAWYEAWAAA